jgi:phosphoglycolate phosphatase-like HAD superfamily hydrolase
LGWHSLFSGVVTQDLLGNPFPSKAYALEYFLLKFDLEASKTPYVGDRLNDLLAAKSNSMPFVYAEWGYGSSDLFVFNGSFPVIKAPSAASISSCLSFLEN